MSEWQPIETAPKDGTPILGGWVCECPDGSKYMAGVITMYEVWDGRGWHGAWVYIGPLDSLGSKDDPPTHWLPIPAPPADHLAAPGKLIPDHIVDANKMVGEP